jgi:hypothetical protein
MLSDPRERVALRAQELKLVFLGLMMSLPALMDPSLPILDIELRRAGIDPSGDMPIVLGDGESEKLQYSLREVLTKVTQLHGDVLARDLMSVGMMQGVTRLHDILLQDNLMRRNVPLLEFVSHFRNACAHGDRWHFKKNEPDPQYPAVHRQLTLKADFHGKRATWTTVTPRLYVELLDDFGNHFVPGIVPSPAGP